MADEQIEFESNGTRLVGMLYRPERDAALPGFVFCPPFAEERKCAYRVLVHAARALADRGHPVLRFDLSGTGDSAGDPADGRPSRWRDDIRTGMAFVRERTGAGRISLLGLRLGATLAAQVAAREPVCDLILWEPITDGPRYISLNLRRSLIKRALTEGDRFEAGASAQREAGDGSVDFDGHLVSAGCHEEIEGIDLLAEAAPKAERVLIVNITPRPALTKACQELGGHYREAGLDVTAVPVREQPFWNLIGLVTGDETIGATVNWCAQPSVERSVP